MLQDLDKNCQELLGFLYANRLDPKTKTKWLFHTLQPNFPNLKWWMFEDLLAILFNDGFLDCEKLPTGAPAPMIYFSISYKGIAFIFSGTYELRRKKETIQLKLSESQITLNNSQININDKQSDLIVSQLKTNSLSEITNIYVALFTGIAGVYYLSELLQKYIPASCSRRNLIIGATLGVCVSAGIYGYTRMQQIRTDKRKQ